MRKRSFLLLFLTLFSACSTMQKPPLKPLHYQQNEQAHILQKQNQITTKLYRAYKKWAGVNYCYGGEDLDGVDCSALVQQIYKEAFHIHIPRTTRDQLKTGISVTKKDLKEGDLLFFKIASKGLHTGIYLQNGNFIHASSKYGVRISNLDNPYWKAHYYQAKRLLF